MIFKKLIHYIYYLNKINNLYIITPFLFLNFFYPNLFFDNYLIKSNNNISFISSIVRYKDIYNIKFLIKTKHLFLFTLYIVYSKLTKILNSFYFKFQFLTKKEKKITILRAPCNHKNSKEQFGFQTYTSIFIYKLPYLHNKFYSHYIFSFFFTQQKIGFYFLKNIIKLNENHLFK